MPPTDQAKEHHLNMISFHCLYMQHFLSHLSRKNINTNLFKNKIKSADLICVEYLAMMKVSMREDPVNSTADGA